MDNKLNISSIMKELGIPASLLGYRYLQYAIDVAVSDISYVDSITKRLYPSIAKQFGTTPARVERACRHAIEVGWDRGNATLKQKIFGFSINPIIGKPTNSEFIANVADYISAENSIF